MLSERERRDLLMPAIAYLSRELCKTEQKIREMRAAIGYLRDEVEAESGRKALEE